MQGAGTGTWDCQDWDCGRDTVRDRYSNSIQRDTKDTYEIQIQIQAGYPKNTHERRVQKSKTCVDQATHDYK